MKKLLSNQLGGLNYMKKFDINKLTTQEKIGQLIVAGFHGTTVGPEIENLIREYKVGNILLFSRNIESAAQLFKLNQDLQKIAMETFGIPLYITIDQEGGMVTRIFEDGTFFPGAMTIAATNNVEYAYKIGDLMGKELIDLGINMDLAPVLDVNNNPKNPVIGVRSFSDDPDKVALFGNANIRGLQNHVVATAKHFPGHGDTHVDSHLALPKVEKPLNELEKFEFKPFKAAINDGLHAIMSAHINFTHLTEDGLPVTLSKRALTGLLREEMGFEGLIITDGIEMKAIHDNYGTIEATLKTVNAGANLVCICHDLPYQIGASDRFNKALETGELTMDTLNERVARILTYKEKLTVDLTRTYEDVKENVESIESKAFARQVVEEAVTLIKGETFKQHGKTLVISTNPQATSIADEDSHNSKLGRRIREAFANFEVIETKVKPTEVEIADIVSKASAFDQIVYTSYNGNVYQTQIQLIDALSALNKDLHVLALRNPYDLYYTKNIKNYVAFYEYTPNSIEAVVKYLKGQLKPQGVSPIRYE
jgi:beta-N-acetylhexosaminidase